MCPILTLIKILALTFTYWLLEGPWTRYLAPHNYSGDEEEEEEDVMMMMM